MQRHEDGESHCVSRSIPPAPLNIPIATRMATRKE